VAKMAAQASGQIDAKDFYLHYCQKVKDWRKSLNRPLCLAEKILFSHLGDASNTGAIERGKSFLHLSPDRVAMQDATAQMAILQFIQSGKKNVSVPTTVHCDHLIKAYQGSSIDLKSSKTENSEVYDFLQSASAKYGIGFWGPGAGIIHQVVLENYAFPGCLLIGTDSHTPNGGGLGMLAIGVGGADAVDVMAGMSWELLNPHIAGIKLTGKLQPWVSPKDIILKVLEILTVKGGTNKIIEYFGPGCAELSCTGKGTITNMGAELGATTSVFPFDQRMVSYLKATYREDIANEAQKYQEDLIADVEVSQNPEKYYDEVHEINLDKLEPYIVGPHSPDFAREISDLPEEVQREKYPPNIHACLIGSCTNSSYEDIYKAAEVAKEALKKGLKASVPFYVTPGSMQVFSTVKRDGLLDILEDFGGTVLANACGPCIGQWKRDDIKKGEKNTIVTSFNRNFRGRNDANPETLSFITSPEVVVAYAIEGRIDKSPFTYDYKSQTQKLSPPQAPELPPKGFIQDISGFKQPPARKDVEQIEVIVKADSQRLQLLAPFDKWDGNDFKEHLLLLKAKGKCTTDHISPAGPWLKFRGHLDKISDNMFNGAQNAFYEQAGTGLNQLTGKYDNLSKVARDYKKHNKSWIVVGDENYGEGSSREHAAMSPRFLGASCVIVKSFARIHETNLKKQGVLALTFANPSDYELIKEKDKISIQDLKNIEPNSLLTASVDHGDGSNDKIKLKHSYNKEQIKWFHAGSALNLIS
jgi:aconitate hydratase